MSYKDCPFCALERKTDWYYAGVAIHVVRDLNDRGFKYRLLAVPIGEANHQRYSGFSDQTRMGLRKVGMAVAKAHIANGLADEIAKIDHEHFSYPDHGHVQICMR